MSTDKQDEAVVAESTKGYQGKFPKFLDKKEWKVLTNDNPKGENDPNKILYYRVVERTNKKIDLEIKAESPVPKTAHDRVVSRRIRELLDKNQHIFQIQGAGVTMFGGCLPLYRKAEDERPFAYTQCYRFTLRIV